MENNKTQDTAESGTIFPITVELRPVDKGKMKALADVTITMGDQGTLKALGFPVFSDGGTPHVGSPSRKGTSRYFDTVTLNGPIRRAVELAVIAEFERQGLA